MKEELALAIRQTCLSMRGADPEMRERVLELIGELDKFLACMEGEETVPGSCPSQVV